jgi:hypothetical protein
MNPWNRHDRHRTTTLPSWVIYVIISVAGLIMEYLWTDWKPSLENAELKIHTGEYYSGGLNTTIQPRAPLARDDNYLLLLGFFLLLDTTKWMQWIFSTRMLLSLGRRSFSKRAVLLVRSKEKNASQMV